MKLEGTAFRKMLIAGIAIAAIIYSAFFSSRFWMPSSIVLEEDVPQPGSVMDYMDGRQATFLSATFSPSQSLLEVAIQLSNTSLDGVDTYYFVAVAEGSDTENPEVHEVFSDWLMTILRIDVDNFEEIKLYFAPKIAPLEDITDAQTGIITLNNFNVKEGKVNVNKTETEYFRERIDVIVAGYKSDLEERQKAYTKLSDEINTLTEMNSKLREEEGLMTQEEIVATEEQIVDNVNAITEKTKKRDEEGQAILDIEQKITEAEAVKGNL
jgi:hypothetical protein